MVRLFSKPFGTSSSNDLGLPLLTQPTRSKLEIGFPVRATVEETYDQLINDLKEASILLPSWIENGRTQKYAALAYLARIYFQQRNYDMAEQYASQVLDSSSFELNVHPADFFVDEGSKEEIWAVVHLTQEPSQITDFTRESVMTLTEDLVKRGFSEVISPFQQARLDSKGLILTDLRKSTLTYSNSTTSFSLKYKDPVAADDTPILRLAETMLIKAEAKVRLEGVNSESIELLNEIRRRSLRVADTLGNSLLDARAYIDFQETDFMNPDELIEAIVRERRVEFFLEGNRFHDLIRLGRSVRGYGYDDDALRWPIPQSEVDANSNLVQNLGY